MRHRALFVGLLRLSLTTFLYRYRPEVVSAARYGNMAAAEREATNPKRALPENR